MPGMNGLAFRREQLRDPELAAIPVVVCSGTGFIPEKQTELMGIAKFLRKPTDIKDLLQLFIEYWARRRAARVLASREARRQHASHASPRLRAGASS